MKRTIRIIGVPMDLGQNRRGVDMGPSAVRYAGLQARLNQLGHEVHDEGNVHVPNPEEEVAEVIRDTVENLKGYIRDRWKAEDDAKRKEAEKKTAGEKPGRAGGSTPADSSGVTRVYLICDPRDEAAIEPIEDILFDSGIEVLLPEFEGEEAAISDVPLTADRSHVIPAVNRAFGRAIAIAR